MNRFDRSRQVLAVCLAGLAGFVDATGYLSAHGYFVSFMSGNTTRLAVNLAQDPRAAIAPLLLICGFVAGVVGGALVAARAGEARKPAVLGLVACLLMVAGMAGSGGWTNWALAAMVTAMGAINNTFQRDGEVAVGVTYMTGALVRLGQAIAARVMGRRGGSWAPHLMLWLGLAGGAVTGAVAFHHFGVEADWIACGWAWVLALAARGIGAKAPR